MALSVFDGHYTTSSYDAKLDKPYYEINLDFKNKFYDWNTTVLHTIWACDFSKDQQSYEFDSQSSQSDFLFVLDVIIQNQGYSYLRL